MYIRVCMHVCMYECMCVHTPTPTHACMLDIVARTGTYIRSLCIIMHSCVQRCMYTCYHTCMRNCTYAFDFVALLRGPARQDSIRGTRCRPYVRFIVTILETWFASCLQDCRPLAMAWGTNIKLWASGNRIGQGRWVRGLRI